MRGALEIVFPRAQPESVDAVIKSLDGSLGVGDDRIVDFLARCARAMLAPVVTRTNPELAPLGFFLRRAELGRLTSRLERRSSGALKCFRVPRGLVFHVPPTNVDTVFVYSWALSALAGNRNVVRISPRARAATTAILAILNDALAESDPVVAATQKMVVYGREDAATAAFSAACDLRVIWGGDESVASVRSHALSPGARDLTFPNRASFAAASVGGWRRASSDERERAVQAFYNDAYWFDQAACSSPRSVLWVGPAEEARQARREFTALLEQFLVVKKHTVSAAMAVQKRVLTYGAAAKGLVDVIDFHTNALTTLELVSGLERDWLGTGSFPQRSMHSLRELIPLIRRSDQTLSVFGFDGEELEALAVELGSAGIDRIVPWGSALSFSQIWDGYDLLHEFTRIRTLSV